MNWECIGGKRNYKVVRDMGLKLDIGVFSCFKVVAVHHTPLFKA